MARPVRLNWRLALEERQRVSDGVGGFLDTWIVLGNMWGEVRPGSVSTTAVSAGETSRMRHKIVVRGAAVGVPERPKIGQRFRNSSKVYSIESVSEMTADATYLLCWTHEEVLA